MAIDADLYDIAYFQDDRKDRYCPLDFYILLYKFYGKLHRKEAVKLENDCREQLKHFCKNKEPENSYEKKVISKLLLTVKCGILYRLQFLKEYLRNSLRTMIIYNMLLISEIWQKNVIPILSGQFEAIELQHGIITAFHPGYIYQLQIRIKSANDF